jgi:hypothetical protein
MGFYPHFTVHRYIKTYIITIINDNINNQPSFLGEWYQILQYK